MDKLLNGNKSFYETERSREKGKTWSFCGNWLSAMKMHIILNISRWEKNSVEFALIANTLGKVKKNKIDIDVYNIYTYSYKTGNLE